MTRTRLPLLTTRRQLLQLVSASLAASALPACGSSGGDAPADTGPVAYAYKFLTEDEIAELGVLADVILPPDSKDPGGKDLGAAEFVDCLLSAFEGGGPIWAGGPFSGRAPTPGPDGSPSGQYPTNDFAAALPLDRVHETWFRYLIYGSATQPGPNDAIDGPFAGYRTIVREGLANADQQAKAKHGAPLAKLAAADAAALFGELLKDTTGGGAGFANLLLTFVVQAAFSAPEYGGNPGLAGWKLAHWEGDRQPLGYSWYDPATKTYREDPDHPVSTANPYPDPDPMDADTIQLVGLTVYTQNAGS